MNLLKKINTYKSLLIIVSITFLVIRLISLGFDQTNNDSIRWFIRSENFLQALKDGNFSETYQKYHPGVTLMLVNSFFKQGFYFYQYNFTDYKLDLLAWNIFPYFNLFSKLTIILLIFGVILLQTSLIRKLWSEKTALFYFFFISIEPYFVGINRWFHLTSFEVIFGFTAVLYILYWLKNRTYQNLAFSSIFLALAVLTKVTSVVIGPVILIILVSDYLKNRELKPLVYYLTFYLTTIFVLFPALWVEPIQTSGKIIDSIFHAVGEDPRVYLLSPFLNKFFYLVVLPFKLSPIILFLFAFAIFNFKKIKSFELLTLFLLIGIYLAALSASDQKIDRYSLVFFQPIILISAIYLGTSSSIFQKITVTISVIFTLFIGLIYNPQYSAYYTPLFGGTKSAIDNGIYENGGTYFYDAAKLLNQIDPQKKVFVPNNIEAFSLFYNGKTLRDPSDSRDYVVVSLDIDRKEFDSLGCPNLVQEFGPFDYKVVAIYSCK
jgi:hypothetical protein